MSYIAEGRNFTYGIKTLTAIDSIVGMQEGDSVWCSDYSRLFTYDGSHWMCAEFIKVVNRSGASLSRWDVVVAHSGGTVSETACTTTTVDGAENVLGVVIFGGADGAWVVVAIKGNYRVNVNSAVALGDDLTTSTTAGKAETNIGTYYAGVFAFATESSVGAGTVNCIVVSRKEIY